MAAIGQGCALPLPDVGLKAEHDASNRCPGARWDEGVAIAHGCLESLRKSRLEAPGHGTRAETLESTAMTAALLEELSDD